MTKDEAELLERLLEAFKSDLTQKVDEVGKSVNEQGKSIVRMEEQLKVVNGIRDEVRINARHILEVTIALVVGLLGIVGAVLIGG